VLEEENIIKMLAKKDDLTGLPPKNDTKYNIVKKGVKKCQRKGTHQRRLSISCGQQNYCSTMEIQLVASMWAGHFYFSNCIFATKQLTLLSAYP
jgi:hypothetical protein